ncbi:hypothetical protein M8J77_004948 [Diaphorina citri]|nr:hypothetical protein M8J77_004948 [Diaphorina citri]
MNQCHVHVDFKAYRQHLRLNLGVHVKVNDDLKSLDLVTTKRGPSPPDPNSECPPDMFAIYEQNSPSLQQLLLPRHELLSDDVYGTNAKKIVIKDDRQKSGTSAFPGTAKGVSGFPGTAKGVSGFPGTAKGVSGVPGTAKGVSGFPGTAKGVSTVVGTAKGVSELRRGTTNRVSGEFGTAAKPRYACPKVRQRRVQSEECVVYLAPQKKILDCDLKPGETVPKLPIKYVL